MTSAIIEFLSKNSIPSSSHLPLVHTTPAYYLPKILKEKVIDPRPCDTFIGEDLAYFFYGRPAYKFGESQQDAKYWELPALVIIDYDQVSPKRTFPFDSGAFKKYPNFISMMDRDEFDAATVIDAAPKIVGSFFVDATRYFKMMPRSAQGFNNQFAIDALDVEIKALQELALSFTNKIDDRRMSIELQSSESVKLVEKKVLAVIMPEEYGYSSKLMEWIKALGAQPIFYPVWPLRQEMYYAAIYSLVFEFYRSKNLVR